MKKKTQTETHRETNINHHHHQSATITIEERVSSIDIHISFLKSFIVAIYAFALTIIIIIIIKLCTVKFSNRWKHFESWVESHDLFSLEKRNHSPNDTFASVKMKKKTNDDEEMKWKDGKRKGNSCWIPVWWSIQRKLWLIQEI